MDDLTVEILTGLKYIYSKGPLTKIVSRKTKPTEEENGYNCAFRQSLRLLDFSKCNVTVIGKNMLEDFFGNKCRIMACR